MRYFLLDKQFLMKEPCQARVIAISDNEFTREEIEQAMDNFKTIDTLVYVGEDIPHYIEYDYMNDTIKEKIIISQEEIQEEDIVQKPKKIFDDSIEVQPNVYYFYIDKKRADEQGISETKATFERPVLNPLEYFGIETYMVKANTIPYYVTYDNYDNGIREANKFERYERGQYILANNEVIVNNNIYTLKEGELFKNGVVEKIIRPEDTIRDYYWNFEKGKWEQSFSDDEFLEMLEKQILDATTEINSRISLGLPINKTKIKRGDLLDKHKRLSEEIALKINKNS